MMLNRRIKRTPTVKLNESQWQQLRKSFSDRGMIGGSDAGTLLGWNKWKSPITLYYQALDLSPMPQIMNVEMAMGKMQEDNIAECWQYWDGEEKFVENVIAKNAIRRYKKIKAIIENPKYPVLFANIDGLIVQHPVRGKQKGILEVKKINGMTADSYIGGIPPQYIAQVQHYMLVCELPYAELAMRVDGRTMIVETIDADWELQSTILHEAHVFNDRVTKAKQAMEKYPMATPDEKIGIVAEWEPAADASQDFNDFISARHKARETERIITGDAEHELWARQYWEAGQFIKVHEEQKMLHGNRLKQVMEKEGATVMELPHGKITWRKQFNVKLNA